MKKLLLASLLLSGLCLTACHVKEDSQPIHTEQTSKPKQAPELLLSNLSDQESVEEVSNILKSHLDQENVDRFIKGVTDYNETIQQTGLTKGFEKTSQPEYDVDKLDKLWTAKKGDFIGTNCRINTYTLLKNTIQIGDADSDDSLLFLDNNAIKYGHVLTDEESQDFHRLFSKVKTEATKDIYQHAQKMTDHFSKMSFNDKATMVSVVLHDNLDGDFLFVGHVGVLVEDKEGYLFVEKLSFEEPFQSIKFKTKEDCFNYLYSKYEHYHDDTTAKPFIMENDKLIELEAYKK